MNGCAVAVVAAGGNVKLKNSQQRKQKCGGENNRGQGSGPLISSGCTEALGGSLVWQSAAEGLPLSQNRTKKDLNLAIQLSTPRGHWADPAEAGGAITSCPTLRVGVKGYSLILFV